MSVKTATSNAPVKRNYALPIAIMFALFFMIAFVTGYQNPLGSVIKKMSDGNMFWSQLGTLANFIAYAIMGYPAGKILQQYGYRITAICAVAVGFFGVLVTFLSGMFDNVNLAIGIYIVGAFIAGFSMCMLNTTVNPMLNSMGSTPKKGNQMVQFGCTFNSLGATLAPVVVGGLLGGAASTISSANPVFFLAMGIFAAAFIVLFFSKLPENPNLGKPTANVSVRGALKYRNFVFGLFAIFCYVGLEVGIANFNYQYIENSNVVAGAGNSLTPAAIAGSVVGIYWLLMLVGRFLGGVIGGWVSSRTMLIICSLGAIICLCLGIFGDQSVFKFFGFDSSSLSFGTVLIPVNAFFFSLCGLFASVMWGAIFNLAVTGLGKYTAVASGLFMAMVCGGGVFPFFQGLIADVSILGSFFLPASLAFYLLIYAIFLSKANTNLPEENEVL